MGSAEERITELGGIATTGELIALSYNPQYLRVLAEFGRIVRIRTGWYANNEVDEAVIQARRVGGILACMSALAHHGWCEPEPNVVHVSVPRSASRLRSHESPKEIRESAGSTRVVVHWSRRGPTGDRQSVSLGEAIAQANSCTRGRDTL
jgi:predicted transcriptional regulator of viral defense system